MSEKRTILTGVGTYVDKHGNPGAWGFKGDEVEVHEDFLEEFDAINVENGDGEEVTYERVGVNMFSPVAAAQARSDEDEEEEEEEESSSSESSVRPSVTAADDDAKKAPAKKV